ncbi:MAG TPA: 2,3-bisphosphoglycerate-independent phosphoglycerate mutase, partial [Geoalkalibacter subterraneus]|nr:2,3-bisphosphoglycerate-independent phosphoglycerate mutase [Geoalkalibacter subterraneus]
MKLSAKRPVALVILDGWGINPECEGNAVCQADTPNLDRLFEKYPHARLGASGEAVGLPDGQMGNSEVGHLNIGAGRIVYQEFTRITKSIKDGDFFSNPVLTEAVGRVKQTGGTLHLMGLLSD